MEESKSWSLVVAQEATNALDIFTSDNVEKLIGDVESEVRSIVCDVTTAKGRKEIASLAHKVSRSKTALDALGKDLVSDWKTKTKAVDSERKQIRDRLDALRDEVRKPLTDWEEEEKQRIENERLEKERSEAHELAIEENELFDRERKIILAEQKLRQEEAERVEKQRVEQEKREAKEKAERDEKARVAREEQIRKDVEEKAKADAEKAAQKAKEDAEQKIIDARLAEEKAKQKLIEAEERKEQELKDQQERIVREHEEAQAAAQKKLDDQKAEEEKKAANKAHQRAVNKGILAEITALGISKEHAMELITKTAKGEIKNLAVLY